MGLSIMYVVSWHAKHGVFTERVLAGTDDPERTKFAIDSGVPRFRMDRMKGYEAIGNKGRNR